MVVIVRVRVATRAVVIVRVSSDEGGGHSAG